jgi:histidinol dehydrogenase
VIFRRLEWTAPHQLAPEIREWLSAGVEAPDVSAIEAAVAEGGDAALLELTRRYDATDCDEPQLVVTRQEAREALAGVDPAIAEALGIAVANVSEVARAQIHADKEVTLPQGQTVTVGEVPVRSAGIYAPGGRARYPSSVVMGCATARIAGVERVVLVTPPGPDGQIDPVTLAAAALCEVDEVFAVGGAQAIFALARGTESIRPVDVIAGPGNAWVQAAKKKVFGEVSIDSLAGPSDLTVVFDAQTDLSLVALDLCAQAEHGQESPLVAVAVGEGSAGALERLETDVQRVSEANPSVNDCRIAMVGAPSPADAIELVNLLAPEHLQLMDPGSAALAAEAVTAGCVFTGPEAATAFGDYIAGSNHILPTDGTGKSFGPVSPTTFRRSSSRVSLTPGSASALAEHLNALAKAEGLPVHGLSATARAQNTGDPK